MSLMRERFSEEEIISLLFSEGVMHDFNSILDEVDKGMITEKEAIEKLRMFRDDLVRAYEMRILPNHYTPKVKRKKPTVRVRRKTIPRLRGLPKTYGYAWTDTVLYVFPREAIFEAGDVLGIDIYNMSKAEISEIVKYLSERKIRPIMDNLYFRNILKTLGYKFEE